MLDLFWRLTDPCVQGAVTFNDTMLALGLGVVAAAAAGFGGRRALEAKPVYPLLVCLLLGSPLIFGLLWAETLDSPHDDMMRAMSGLAVIWPGVAVLAALAVLSEKSRPTWGFASTATMVLSLGAAGVLLAGGWQGGWIHATPVAAALYAGAGLLAALALRDGSGRGVAPELAAMGGVAFGLVVGASECAAVALADVQETCGLVPQCPHPLFDVHAYGMSHYDLGDPVSWTAICLAFGVALLGAGLCPLPFQPR